MNHVYHVINVTSSTVSLVLLDQAEPRYVSLAPWHEYEIAHLSDLGEQVLAMARAGIVRVLLGTELITDWVPELRAGAPPPPTNPPVITSLLSVSATVGAPFSYQITATNSPSSFAASGLPSGLSINGAGLISGTPVSAGSHNINISATNADGTGSAVVLLTIGVAQAPEFAFSTNDIYLTAGEYWSFDLTVEPNPLNPPAFQVANLPDGLSSYQQMPSPPWPYIIYGVPTTAGTWVVDIEASNVAGVVQTQLTIHVTQPAFIVSGTGTPFDDTYNAAEDGYFYWDFDSGSVGFVSGAPSALYGVPKVYRSANNNDYALFYFETYDAWMLADLSSYYGGPPAALSINASSSSSVLPPETTWSSPSMAPATISRA